MNKKQAVEREVKEILRGLTPKERVKFAEGFFAACERAGRPPTADDVAWLDNLRKEAETLPDKRPTIWDQVKHTAYQPKNHDKKPERIGKIRI